METTEKRLTCAIKMSNNKFDDNFAEMCPHCSSAKFSKDEKEPHWECKKYKIRLNEDENSWLTRCDKCLELGD
jgi:hypothetical protein